MLDSLPVQGMPSLGPGDLNPATENTQGNAGGWGTTATSGTGKLGRLAAPFITSHLRYTKRLNQVLRSWRMGNRGSKAWTSLCYQQPLSISASRELLRPEAPLPTWEKATAEDHPTLIQSKGSPCGVEGTL